MIMKKRVCECCLTPLGNIYSYIMTRTSYIFDEMIMMLALLDLVLVYWHNSPRIGMSNTLTHYYYSEPTSRWSFSLVMGDLQRSNIYQLNNLWFDPTGFQTYDIPHSRRERWPLPHHCFLWRSENSNTK
jgi:hypothetical protein